MLAGMGGKKTMGNSQVKGTSKEAETAKGFTDITRNSGTVIIVGEHVAKMWEASKKGNK
jgi:hypothetical protein